MFADYLLVVHQAHTAEPAASRPMALAPAPSRLPSLPRIPQLPRLRNRVHLRVTSLLRPKNLRLLYLRLKSLIQLQSLPSLNFPLILHARVHLQAPLFRRLRKPLRHAHHLAPGYPHPALRRRLQPLAPSLPHLLARQRRHHL